MQHKQYLEVIRYAYLKTCVNKWVLHNSAGGSFTNSGEYRSLKALVRAFRAQYPDASVLETPVVFRTIHGFDANDKPVETVCESYFAKLFGTEC